MRCVVVKTVAVSKRFLSSGTKTLVSSFRYAKARDWRAQLRTKTKLEVHMDALALSDGKLPSEVAPIYKLGTSYFYYIPKVRGQSVDSS